MPSASHRDASCTRSPEHHPPPTQPPPLRHAPTRQTRSDFDLEPNPFEQSFSRPSHIRHTSVSQRGSASPASDRSRNSHSDRQPSPSSISRSKHDTGRSSPRTVLPPLAAIASPSDQSYPWQFSSSLANSLRAGPLSPAMLAGPQQGSDSGPLPFDTSSFPGLTPRIGLTPRTGLTPGLTPLVGGPVSFPPASPNTAAFLALMNNGASGSSNPTITPNTLSAITGVLNNSSSQYSTATHAPTTSSHLSTSITANQDSESAYIGAGNAASTAANGLYLLSQAHQELTKREEAQARANGAAVAPVNGRRGTKRKSYDVGSPPPGVPPRSVPQQSPVQTKRTRANTLTSVSTNGHSKESGEEEEEEEEDDDDESHQQSLQQQNTQSDGASALPKGKQQKKPETEEEKRRNFLERNRQAALKCRQRKKAWLASLQAKVEYLTTENERLAAALVSSREEISRLSALVGSAVIGPGGATVGPGIVPSSAAVVANGQPVSMSMNMAAKGGGAATTRASYGY